MLRTLCASFDDMAIFFPQKKPDQFLLQTCKIWGKEISTDLFISWILCVCSFLNERCMVAPAVRQNKYKLLDCKLLCVPSIVIEWLEAEWQLMLTTGTHCLETCTIKEPFFIIKLQSQKSTLASRLIKILSLSRLHRTFLSPTLSLFLKENELEFFHL